VSDIFREVEEEVRRERLERIWKEYGDYIVAVAALLILAGAGWRLWNVYESREAARASNRFMAAQNLLDGGQSRMAAENFAKLAQTAPGGYAKLSQLAEADSLAASNNQAAALNIYRKLAGDNDEILSAIARIRAAWILVDGAPKSDLENLIGPLAANDSPWRDIAREVLAYADYRGGAVAQAQKEFDTLAKDKKAPSGVRGRSQAMATLLAASGGKDFGQIPPMLPETPVTVQKPGGAAPTVTSGTAPPTASGTAPPANAPPATAAKTAAPVSNVSKPASSGGTNANPKGPSPK
jgi:hypothetical protein